MPFIDTDSGERYEAPHAPGEWYELRPIMAGDLEAGEGLLPNDGPGPSRLKVSYELLARVIVKWWDEGREITPENVRKLDLDSYVWLDKIAQEISGIRGTAAKNPSAGGSSRGQRRRLAAVASR